MWVLLPKKGTIMNPGIGESQHKVIWQRRVGMLKMHDNEVETDASLVGRLLTTQFPQWAQLPVIPVASAGTDNALYRLGDDMVVRLPRIDWAVDNVHKEYYWLPRLAPLLPLAIPVPLAKGSPGAGYPWHWSVYEWLAGENATMDGIADPHQAAINLARFITALQQIDTTKASPAIGSNSRGRPLASRDERTHQAIARLHGMIDTDAATAVWEAALQAPERKLSSVWFHGDLLPGNLLFEGDRLSAVIDFGGMGVGDPTCDLMIAWSLFSGQSRNLFRQELDIDDATWARGRGHALSQAVVFIPYYLHTNPTGVNNARHQLREAIADFRTSG
ncbi:MAG: aminoglycoside phosphotransferase family protein [Candidatus Poribacteria bacterium]|nr:aminoglycoside phosphotransferase family protein [Candidatus Poribacteria bacterium]MDP6995031.1 aminoglycoside phosphotransferase family protein [Candidatus Poribacteria bacterium]